jgi:hypothetical protein
MVPVSGGEQKMAWRIDLEKSYIEKALEYAEGSATRASNQKGLNEMIRQLHQKDAKLFRDARVSMTEVK